MKSLLHLLGRAAEFDPGAAARYALHCETLRLKPRRDPVHVVLANAETLGVLLRREPLVVIGGSWVLLVREQLLKSGLLAGRRLHGNSDSRHRKRCGHRSTVKLRTRARGYVTSQRDNSRVADRPAQAIRLR